MPEYRCVGGHDKCREMTAGPDCPHCEATYLRDPVVAAVCTDLLERSEVGQKKYGVTLARTDLGLRDWLQHAYEETLDQGNYLKRAIMELDRRRAEEKALFGECCPHGHADSDDCPDCRH